MSAFEVLLGSGCDHSLTTLNCFGHKLVSYLHGLFAPVYKAFTSLFANVYIRKLRQREAIFGRPRTLSSHQCLGLVLGWGRTRGSAMVLSILFGVSGSICSFIIRFAGIILLRVLSKDENVKVRMPRDDEMPELLAAISSKYPFCKGYTPLLMVKSSI